MIVEDQKAERVSAEIPAAPIIRSRRNPKWVALGVVAVCLGAIASFFLYSQLAESEQVVAVRSTVSRGSTIAADDIGVVRVGDTGGIRTVPAEDLKRLVGQVAAYDLVEGSLLAPGAVTTTLPPAPGNGIIGIRVASGRAPAGFLAPGSPVRLVVLPPGTTGADGAAAGTVATGETGGTGETDGEATNVATIPATVVDTRQLDDAVLINVELKSAQAVDAASYAAQERITVVRESER